METVLGRVLEADRRNGRRARVFSSSRVQLLLPLLVIASSLGASQCGRGSDVDKEEGENSSTIHHDVYWYRIEARHAVVTIRLRASAE